MRKLTFGLLAGLVATVACETGVGPESPELGSTLDPDGAKVAAFSATSVASGSGHIRRGDGSIRKFTISAVQHVDGSTSGQYDLKLAPIELLKDFDVSPPLLSFHGTITCMKVVGNSAYLGGVVDRQENGGLFFGREDFTGVAMELIDNGEAHDAAPDQISSVFVYFPETPTTPQDYCDDPTPGPVFPIDQGNITVR